MSTLHFNTGIGTKIQLCLMMFLQYMLSAVWWVPLAAYLSHTLKLEVYQVSLVLSAMAIGAIADRYFAAEKILAVLNILTGVFLLLAAQQQDFPPLMFFVVMAMLCHMPTQSLTSTIAMSHAPSEQFPRIRMFGSVGWVASGIFSLVAIHLLGMEAFDDTNLPMYCGAGVCFIAAFANLTLPHTPPSVAKSTKISVMDITGFSAFSLMKDKNYRVFMILTFLSIIPFTLYQMFFLIITTTILVKSGIKNTLIFGMAAMLVRYGAFFFGAETGQQWFYYIGIIVHGLIFGLFYVGGQVYTDNVAPKEMKAQAQGLLFFLVWGIGFLIGTLWNGWLIGQFRDGDKCDWPVLFLISSACTAVLLFLFIFLFKPVSLKTVDK